MVLHMAEIDILKLIVYKFTNVHLQPQKDNYRRQSCEML